MPRKPSYRAIPKGAIRVDLPNTFQIQDYTCGPAALMAIFAYYGVGPEEEWDLEEMMRIGTSGTDPVHLVNAARKCGLRTREYRPMTGGQLRSCLDRGRPVLLMLQAWGDRRSYRTWWKDGHWVVAIGYDADVIYFEDPSLYRARGYLSLGELDDRWHDVEGAPERKTEHYGLELWKPGVRRSVFLHRARRIQ